MSLSARVSFTLTALVLVALAGAAAVIAAGRRVQTADRAITHEVADIQRATDLAAAVLAERISLGAYLLSRGDARWSLEMEASAARFQADLAALRATAERAEERALLEVAAAAGARNDEVRGRVVALFDQGRSGAAETLFLSSALSGYDAAVAASERVRDLNGADMRRALNGNQRAMQWLRVIMIASAALTLLLGGGTLWLVFGGILAPVRRMAARARAASSGEARAAGPGHLAPPPRPVTADEVAELGFSLQALVAELERARSASPSASSSDDQASRQRAVGVAVAHVAHEFRNALTSIGGFARFIQRHPDDPARVHQDAALIARSAENIEHLVRETLEYARPTRLAPALSSINASVRQAVELVKGRLGEAATIRTELDPEAPQVPLDAASIERVIVNLVGNAVDAAGPRGTVSVRTASLRSGVDVIVEDDGPGIPPEIGDRLFEPFVTTKRGGSGLGLAICRQIVLAHGGTIRWEPAPGRGTLFRVNLPGLAAVRTSA